MVVKYFAAVDLLESVLAEMLVTFVTEEFSKYHEPDVFLKVTLVSLVQDKNAHAPILFTS